MRKEKDTHKPILSVRIDAELLGAIDKLCERTGVGRAEIVERCLTVGLQDQEEFVEWLESPVKGPLLHLLLHPAVLKTIVGLMGMEVDETQQKVRQNIAAKKRMGRARPATE